METSKQLRSFDLTIIVISLVIGMGIFRTPSEVAMNAGSIEIYFLAWLSGAIISLFGALTFAEIGSRYPTTGGFYTIFSFCYSPAFAFMVNWITVISNAASTAAVALMGSTYIASVFFPHSPEFGSQLTAIFMVVVLMVVNLFGIKISSFVLNFLMLLKIGFILILIAAAFMITKEFIPAEPVKEVVKHYPPLKAFLLCFVPVFFTFGGYQQTINFGGDVNSPSKTIPRAITIGMLVIMLLYLAVNYSYVSLFGIEGLAATKTLASDIMGLAFGETSSKVTSILMFMAVTTYVNVSILSNPRVYVAMAEDKVLPSALGKIHPSNQVPVNGVLVFCFFILFTLFFMHSFSKILEFVMFFDSISLIAAAGSIFILRKKNTDLSGQQSIYKLAGYPWIPLIYLFIYGAVNVSVLISNPSAFAWGVCLFLFGYPLYRILKWGITGKK
ncbi:MAG: APC family permease [Flavobacteriia bacterium]